MCNFTECCVTDYLVTYEFILFCITFFYYSLPASIFEYHYSGDEINITLHFIFIFQHHNYSLLSVYLKRLFYLYTIGGGKRNNTEGTGLDLQSLHATSLGDKQRSSEAFCMTLIKWSLQSIAAFVATSSAPSATLVSLSVTSPNPFLTFRQSSSSFSSTSSSSSTTPTSNTQSAMSSAPNTHPAPSTSPSPPPLPTPTLSVLESCRILTLLLIHRPSLLEQLLSNSLKASPHANQITPCKTSNKDKEHDSQNVEVSQENVLDTPQQLILMGLALLLPSDGDYSKYELFLSDCKTTSDSSSQQPQLEVQVQVEVAERDRMNRFISWLLVNRVQVSNIFSLLSDY